MVHAIINGRCWTRQKICVYFLPVKGMLLIISVSYLSGTCNFTCYLCTDSCMQKQGLVAIFEEMFERIEHRLCLRHLYANFKKIFGGGS